MLKTEQTNVLASLSTLEDAERIQEELSVLTEHALGETVFKKHLNQPVDTKRKN